MGVPQPIKVPKVKKFSRPISESRKVRKPLMEKRRRDRINACLTSLATLLADPDDTPSSSGTSTSASKKLRLEKADILEQTVQHWHHIEQKSSSKEPSKKITKDTHESPFLLGYEGCINIIDTLLEEMEKEGEDVDFADDLRSHLRQHLNKTSNDDEKDRSEILDVESKVETILTLLPKWLPSGDFALIMREFPDNQIAPTATGCSEGLSVNNFQRLSSPLNRTTGDPQNHDQHLNINVLLQKNVWRPW